MPLDGHYTAKIENMVYSSIRATGPFGRIAKCGVGNVIGGKAILSIIPELDLEVNIFETGQ